MKYEMLLERVQILGDRNTIHASLTAQIPDGNVNHNLHATVVLEYPGEDIMKFTLAQIQADARNRLGSIE